MSNELNEFVLTSRRGGVPDPVLTGVKMEGRLDAVLFDLTLRQSYRNTSDHVLELVYTFPLPPRAVLLGFATELNGERLGGVITGKREAERRYEAALEEGDAPMMLEAGRGGLHTANLGNLRPGDELVVECRFAQVLSFEQGRVRVSIPTTIAPRHGRAQASGLQPQQVPQASLDADYPLSAALTIGEALAGAAIECPTHRTVTTSVPGGATRIELAPGARLDRDVVVIVTPREPRPSLLVSATDPCDAAAPVVVMATLQPPMAEARERMALKLLVDCSGSMQGDSVASARKALHGVVAGLHENDHLSLSRFGSTVEHLVALSPARPQLLRHVRSVIDGIQADLGGTEMEAALAEVFALARPAEAEGSDVLLITDGEIWDIDPLIATARESGHRVFAIGVGSAPAEGVLRALAEATGGACEFATPGEVLEAAAARMLRRMRQPAFTNARVDWGSTAVWSVAPSRSLFGGDTVIALAGFARPIEAGAVRLLATDSQGQTVELARGEADAVCPGDSLPRLAAARRIARGASTDIPNDTLDLALRYQLMSALTNCILVHRHAEADKAQQQAELHRVNTMLAAGWGGFGRVEGAAFHSEFALVHHMRDGRGGGDGLQYSLSIEADDVPISPRQPHDDPSPATQERMAQSVADHLRGGGALHELAAVCDRLILHKDAQRALDDAVALGMSRSEAWLLLAHWVNTRPGGLEDADMQALLQPWVSAFDPARVSAATQVFDRLLGGYLVDVWTALRAGRLQRLVAFATRTSKRSRA